MKKERKRYLVGGGINTYDADAESTPLNALILKNGHADKRLGGIVRRQGSLSETIAGALALPLGMGQFLAQASTSLIPVQRKLLVNFGGTAFYSYSAAAWSSVSIDSNTSFSGSKQTQFDQLGGNIFIAGGRLAKWDGTNAIERVGCPAPGGTITLVVGGAGTITTTTGWQYMFTFYNPTTGVESDWSPVSASTGAFVNKINVAVTVPTTSPLAASGFTKKRVYRTLDGGSVYYLNNTINIATASYNDATTDAALAGAQAADLGDYGVPPDSYIMRMFNSRCWAVNASNPYELYYSKPYIGSDKDLEYFSTARVKRFDKPITGLLVTPGKMLVFHPRDISYVSGFSDADFQFLPYFSGVGTLFANSCATDGNQICFLSEEGWTAIVNGQKKQISAEIDDDLLGIMSHTYSTSLYVSCCWSPARHEFLMLMTAISAGLSWVDSSTLAVVPSWVDDSSGATVSWVDVASPGSETTCRVKLWGWAPDYASKIGEMWSEYSFPQFADANAASAIPTFAIAPLPSSDLLEPQQDKVYIGYWTGSAGRVLGAFRRDLGQDDGATFVAEVMTGRIAPGIPDSSYKRFFHVELPGSYNDPTSDGQATLQYVIDFDDPHKRDYSSALKSFTNSGDKKNVSVGLGRHIHLYVRDTSDTPGKLLLSEFYVHFRERNRKESR